MKLGFGEGLLLAKSPDGQAADLPALVGGSPEAFFLDIAWFDCGHDEDLH